MTGVVKAFVDGDPFGPGNTPRRGPAGFVRKCRLEGEQPALVPCDPLGESHGGAKIPVLADEDGLLVPLFVGEADQIDRHADIDTLFLAPRVHPAPVDVNPAATQVTQFVGSEAVPEWIVRWVGYPGIEANLTEDPVGDSGDQGCG